MRFVDAKVLSVAHGAIEALGELTVSLLKELVHDTVRPSLIDPERLRRIAQDRTVQNVFQQLLKNIKSNRLIIKHFFVFTKTICKVIYEKIHL